MGRDDAGAATCRLVAHPHSPTGGTRVIQTRITLDATRGLVLTCMWQGDLDDARIPAPTAPRRVEGLWRHTCFEAFVMRAGEQAYHEFNFSPSGEWVAYAFRRYREGCTNLEGDFDPGINVHRDADRLELSAVIPCAFLPPGPDDVPLRLGLSAVIEDRSGVLSYWALRHAPGKPDFHHPDAFALELGPDD